MNEVTVGQEIVAYAQAITKVVEKRPHLISGNGAQRGRGGEALLAVALFATYLPARRAAGMTISPADEAPVLGSARASRAVFGASPKTSKTNRRSRKNKNSASRFNVGLSARAQTTAREARALPGQKARRA